MRPYSHQDHEIHEPGVFQKPADELPQALTRATPAGCHLQNDGLSDCRASSNRTASNGRRPAACAAGEMRTARIADTTRVFRLRCIVRYPWVGDEVGMGAIRQKRRPPPI